LLLTTSVLDIPQRVRRSSPRHPDASPCASPSALPSAPPFALPSNPHTAPSCSRTWANTPFSTRYTSARASSPSCSSQATAQGSLGSSSTMGPSPSAVRWSRVSGVRFMNSRSQPSSITSCSMSKRSPSGSDGFSSTDKHGSMYSWSSSSSSWNSRGNASFTSTSTGVDGFAASASRSEESVSSASCSRSHPGISSRRAHRCRSSSGARWNTHGSSINSSAIAAFDSTRRGHSSISRNSPRSGRFGLLASAPRTSAPGWFSMDMSRWGEVTGSEAITSVEVMGSRPDLGTTSPPGRRAMDRVCPEVRAPTPPARPG
jgi:hypothetical protein